MKRAAEYARRIMDSAPQPGRIVENEADQPDAKVIVECLFEMFADEVKEIIKTRNIQFDRALPSVIKEQNNKWLAVCRYVDKANKPYQLNRLLPSVFLSQTEGLKEFVKYL